MPVHSQKADIETSTDDYAQRFSGRIGTYFLDVQTRITLDLLKPWPHATVLDVGGGHAQLAAPLINAGYTVTVAGSDDVCRMRLDKILGDKPFGYQTCDLLNLPYADGSFDVVTCFRLLTHEENWKAQIAELCRVAKFAVVVDYPDIRSFNILYKFLFKIKRKYEKNTREFRTFRRTELAAEFGGYGFVNPAFKGEFLLPMVVYRALKNVALAKVLEGLFLSVGLTRWFGSPVILRLQSRGGGS